VDVQATIRQLALIPFVDECIGDLASTLISPVLQGIGDVSPFQSIVDLHPNGHGPKRSVSSFRLPTQLSTTFGGREPLIRPHSEEDLINQVIAILLRQRREAKQEPKVHGRENCIDQ
jgi:hypothetical protein